MRTPPAQMSAETDPAANEMIKIASPIFLNRKLRRRKNAETARTDRLHKKNFIMDAFASIKIAESLFSASFMQNVSKLSLVNQASIKLDSVKFLLRLAWEIKAIDDKKYILLSGQSQEIGKQLGGWLKQLKTNPAHKGREQ